MNRELQVSYLKNRPIKKSLLCFTVLMLGFISSVFSQQVHSDFEDRSFSLVINRPEDSLAYKFLNMTYAEVFRRLDIPLEFSYRPLKRGAHDIESGKYDGEVARVFAYQASYPSLIRVEEFLYNTNVSAFALTSFTEALQGWQSLKGSDYKIEYPRGVVISQVNLEKFVSSKNLSTAHNAEQGLKKLLRGRSDIYVGDDLVVFPLLGAMIGVDHGKIHKVGVLQSVPLYMYIHKKNKLLEPRLSQVIKEMKDEGLINQYRKQVFNF